MQITVIIEDGRVKLASDEALSTAQIINLLMNGSLAALNANLEDAPKEIQQDLKNHLYDVFNESASNVLAQFAPEIDMRPDITEEAILNEELKIAESQGKIKRK